MTTKEIQEEMDREKLYARLRDKDVRKKERRLITRKIKRLESDAIKTRIESEVNAAIASQE